MTPFMLHFSLLLGRRILFTLCLLVLPALSTLAAEANNQLTPEEQAAGWQLLFDGESLDHWRTYRKPAPGLQWQALEGDLVLTRRGGGDLITRQTWSDFELKLDWKISEGGNSGIFFLAGEDSRPIFFSAPEIQLLDDLRHRDNNPASHRSGSLYDMIAAPPESQRPAEEWNTLTISHLDGHLEVWQNNVQTVDVQIGGERWNTLLAASKFADWEGFGEIGDGHIGLQDHGDIVSFRNLKIRTLTEVH